jgi:hypothetical protein
MRIWMVEGGRRDRDSIPLPRPRDPGIVGFVAELRHQYQITSTHTQDANGYDKPRTKYAKSASKTSRGRGGDVQ